MALMLKRTPAVAVLVALAAGALARAAPARDGDPLVIGSVWRGKLTQRGGGPDTFECAFKVTDRDGEKFEATLSEKTAALEITYLVRGTIKPVVAKDKPKSYALEFTSFDSRDVKNTSAILGVPYTAALVGKKITGAWKDDEYKIEGEFEFEIAKE